MSAMLMWCSARLIFNFLFFFFQAEDGIRDIGVTGVQTCALPISMRHAHLLGASEPLMHRLVPALVAEMGAAYPELVRAQPRSEERRVGKECRSRWSPYH